MAKYIDPTSVDYRLGGDKLRHLAQDYITSMGYVFRALNELKKNSVEVTDPESGQFMVSDGIFYIRNAGNTEWVPMMKITPYGGLKSDTFGKLQSGLYEERPETADDYDTYWCTDSNGVYRWLDGAWHLILSKNITDLDGYDQVLTQDDVAEDSNDPGKLVRSNSYGVLEYDIEGSPGRLAGKTIFAPEVRNNQVLVFNESRKRWEVKKRDDITWDDTTTTAEPNKIVKTDEDGKIHGNITGSAPIIAGITLDIDTIKDGQVIAYNYATGTFVPVDKDHFTDDDTAIQVTAGKLIKGNVQGKVDGSITGTAEGLHGIPLNAAGMADGMVLRYKASDNSFHFEPVEAVGDAASLVLTADGQTKINYNGSESVMVDMADILGPEYLNILRYYTRFTQMERELANVVLQMEAEGMMPDCNLLLAEDFEYPDKIDQLIVKVTSCAAGDDSVDVDLNYGFIVGSWYWITDGVNAEYVQIKSIIKNGNIHRLILTEPLVNTYEVSMTSMYRTTAWIKDGVAFGSGDVLGWVYDPKVTWRGITSGSSAESDEEWQTGLDYKDNFTMQGNAIFTDDGLVSIM